MHLLNQGLSYGAMFSIRGTLGLRSSMVRRGDTATAIASDIGEFVHSILTTLNHEGLEGVGPKWGTLALGDTKSFPFSSKDQLQMGDFRLLVPPDQESS